MQVSGGVSPMTMGSTFLISVKPLLQLLGTQQQIAGIHIAVLQPYHIGFPVKRPLLRMNGIGNIGAIVKYQVAGVVAACCYTGPSAAVGIAPQLALVRAIGAHLFTIDI